MLFRKAKRLNVCYLFCFRSLPCVWFRWDGKNGSWWSVWSSAVAPSSTFSPSSARGCSTRGKKRRSRDKPEKISWDSTTSTLLIDKCHFNYWFRAKRLSVDRVYNLKDLKNSKYIFIKFCLKLFILLTEQKKNYFTRLIIFCSNVFQYFSNIAFYICGKLFLEMLMEIKENKYNFHLHFTTQLSINFLFGILLKTH